MESVNMSDLAIKMLQWEQVQRLADNLRAIIESMVMRTGKTQIVGNVRATYSGGRKTYDYHTGAGNVPVTDRSVIERFTVIPPSYIDWRKVCEHVKVPKADIPFTQSEPSVKVKLLK